jgi:hypothetical protein
MKLSKEKRDQLVLIGLGTLTVLVGCWYGIINTRYALLAASKTNLVQATEKLADANGWLKRSDTIEADVQRAMKELADMEAQMASSTNLYTWSYQLLDKAKLAHKVEIVDVTRPQLTAVGVFADFPYEATVFTVRGLAFYHDFGKFLGDFENAWPYFRAQNLVLSASPDVAGIPASARRVEEQVAFKVEIVALVKPNP